MEFGKKCVFGLFIIAFALSCFLFPLEIKENGSFKLETNKQNFIQRPFSFIVDENDNVYILDFKAANIKTYDKKGKISSIFGRKGLGPDEFMKPIVIAKNKEYILIYDFILGGFLYKKEKDRFIMIKLFRIPQALIMNAIFIDKSTIVFSGLIRKTLNKKLLYYTLWGYSIKNKGIKYLLPGIIDYGVRDTQRFINKFANYVNEISPMNYICQNKNYIYYIKAVNLDLIRINRRNGKINIFKQKSKHFKIFPETLKKLKRANEKRNEASANKILKRLPTVISLFISPKKNPTIIFSVYDSKRDKQNLFYRVYDVNGNFLKESIFYKANAEFKTELLAYYNKDNHMLYILDIRKINRLDYGFKVSKFKVIE